MLFSPEETTETHAERKILLSNVKTTVDTKVKEHRTASGGFVFVFLEGSGNYQFIDIYESALGFEDGLSY